MRPAQTLGFETFLNVRIALSLGLQHDPRPLRPLGEEELSNETIDKLCEALLTTMDEFSETHRLTTGDAMGALFEVMVSSAKASPQYNPKQLVAEVDEKIRAAVGLQ